MNTYCKSHELTFQRIISDAELTEIFDKIEQALDKPIIRYYNPSGGYFFDIVCDGEEYKSFRIDKGVANRTGRSLTCLKAFSNAPHWTKQEVDIVLNILKEYGVSSKPTSVRPITSKKNISTYQR